MKAFTFIKLFAIYLLSHNALAIELGDSKEIDKCFRPGAQTKEISQCIATARAKGVVDKYQKAKYLSEDPVIVGVVTKLVGASTSEALEKTLNGLEKRAPESCKEQLKSLTITDANFIKTLKTIFNYIELSATVTFTATYIHNTMSCSLAKEWKQIYDNPLNNYQKDPATEEKIKDCARKYGNQIPTYFLPHLNDQVQKAVGKYVGQQCIDDFNKVKDNFF